MTNRPSRDLLFRTETISVGPNSINAQVLELADKQDLGSCAFGREGSTPSLGTMSSLTTNFQPLTQD